MVLKTDYTWTNDLGDTKSNGTYTCPPPTDQQGIIEFNILDWGNLTSNQILSDKLYAAFLGENSKGFSLQGPSFNHFLNLDYQSVYFPFVRTQRKKIQFSPPCMGGTKRAIGKFRKKCAPNGNLQAGIRIRHGQEYYQLLLNYLTAFAPKKG